MMQATPVLKVKRISENATIPSRGSRLAAGYDLSSAADCVIPAKGKGLVPTDLQIAIPEGYGRIAPRSGLAWKHFIDVGAGVIDQDYRGNVGVILFNFSDQDFKIAKADRISQIICVKICLPELLVCESLDETCYGSNGYGSTDLLKVKRISENATIPSRGSQLAAGYDLSSAADCVIPAKGKGLVPTDLQIAIPEGYYGRIAPRSGLAWKHFIDVGAGVIDQEYRENVDVILFNFSDQDFKIAKADRISQIICVKICLPELLVCESLDETCHGSNGYGSTDLLKVKRISENATIPSRGSQLAAGYDLSSAADCVIPARGKGFVPTDLQIAIPEGCYGRIAPRSGLAWKHFIDVDDGVIDQDYRGNVDVLLFNFSDQDFKIAKVDRIAQLIYQKICLPEYIECESLDDTCRGSNGDGSMMQATPVVKFKRISENATILTRRSQLAAGCDLSSAVDCIIPANGRGLVPTDLQIAIPKGYCGRIAPRTGLAWKHFIGVGDEVINPDYRENVDVVLFNFSDQDFKIAKADRIAQLICEKIDLPEYIECESLDETCRGSNGYGSTGVN